MEYGIDSFLATNEINSVLQILVDYFRFLVPHYFPLEANYPCTKSKDLSQGANLLVRATRTVDLANHRY
ncbi:MAG: hypothetical protein BWK78_04575 [Thiotrichaceae bacterium IS1]|nr:MAG: hypothetical protein BWK78_04575 [Thiotrichaceae bacterium IS1]